MHSQPQLDVGVPVPPPYGAPETLPFVQPARPSSRRSKRWGWALIHLVVVVSLAFAVFLFQLGRADWQDDSESCGGQIMQEMVGGYGWVLPLRNERHIPLKPPLFYWMGAVSALARQSGVDLLDARLPSALCAVLCLVVLYLCTRSIAGNATALWAALILIVSPQFIIEARNSRVDMVFCAFLTTGLLLAHRVWEGRGERRVAVAAALCFGLATLAKGPLALALAVLVFGFTAVFAAPAPYWRMLVAPASLAAAVGVPAVWYLAATAQHGVEFLRLHIYDENVSRVIGVQGYWPVWWYIEPLVTGGLPWTLLLPVVVRGRSTLPGRTRRFLWVWCLLMLLFFSAVPGKRRAYLILIRPALAMLIAAWIVPQLERLRPLRREALPPRSVHLVAGGLVLAGVVGVLVLRGGFGGFGASALDWSYWWRQWLQDYTALALAFMVSIGIGGELIMWWGWQRRFDLAAYALVGTLATTYAIGISAGAIVRGEGASFRHLAQRIAIHAPPTEPLAFFAVDDESAIALLFHLRRHAAVVQPPRVEAPCTPPAPGLYLVAEADWEARPCFRDGVWRALERGGPEARRQRPRRLVLARYAPPGSRPL